MRREAGVAGRAAMGVLDDDAGTRCESSFGAAVAPAGEGGAAAAVEGVLEGGGVVVAQSRDDAHDPADGPHLIASREDAEVLGRGVASFVECALEAVALACAVASRLAAIHPARNCSSAARWLSSH